MPVMDGLEMSKKIKEINENTPIIITTAFTDESYLLKAIDIGIDEYVKKPIDYDLLFKYINKEAKEVGYIDGYSNDEIGELVESVNKNIDSTVEGVKKDEKVIEEAKEVCKQASLGVYDVQIQSKAHSTELNDLKNLVNQLISAIGYNVNRVATVLNSYDINDYTARINSTGKTQGTMKAVFDN
jgi:YesN/AraC family two-component response regulator